MCACPIIKRTSFSSRLEYARIFAEGDAGMVAVNSKEEKNRVTSVHQCKRQPMSLRGSPTFVDADA
jgi:hypothetical protein